MMEKEMTRMVRKKTRITKKTKDIITVMKMETHVIVKDMEREVKTDTEEKIMYKPCGIHNRK